MQDYSIIFSRRHPKLKDKEDIYKLISDSYAGGWQFLKGSYLFRYSREYQASYNDRKRRSHYFNYVQPSADIMTGLLFSEQVTRELPSSLRWIIEEKNSYETFIQGMSIHALLYPCVVLVDSPEYDANRVKTEADRIREGLQPYPILYRPWQVRDFAKDEDGELLWILLDDTYTEATDPFVEARDVTRHTLWTKDYLEKFEKSSDGNIVSVQKVEHGLGIVPAVFSNWKDIDQDEDLGETPFEDIALLSRSIYNYMSLMEEMITSGTFKSLFFPSSDGGLPDGLEKDGEVNIGNLSVIPFPIAASNKPYFDGPSLSEITPFLSAIDMIRGEILNKVGMDKDQEKAYVQSGIAKSLEYRRLHAILTLGAENLEKTEQSILELYARWMNLEGEIGNITVEYPKKFDPDRTAARLAELYELITTLPYESPKLKAAEEIIRLSFPDLKQNEIKAMVDEMKKQGNEKESVSDIVDRMVNGKHGQMAETTGKNPDNGEQE